HYRELHQETFEKYLRGRVEFYSDSWIKEPSPEAIRVHFRIFDVELINQPIDIVFGCIQDRNRGRCSKTIERNAMKNSYALKRYTLAKREGGKAILLHSPRFRVVS
ncbi:unnamed protein product, partial [Heterotrigona itama]